MKNGIRNRVKVIRYEQEASKYGIKRSIVWRLADWAFFGIHKAALARKMSAICEWTGNIVASWAPNPLPANLGIEWGELFCNYKADKNVPGTSTRESFKIVLGSSMLSFNLSSLRHITSHSVCRYWRNIHNPKRAQKPHDRHAGAHSCCSRTDVRIAGCGSSARQSPKAGKPAKMKESRNLKNAEFRRHFHYYRVTARGPWGPSAHTTTFVLTYRRFF